MNVRFPIITCFYFATRTSQVLVLFCTLLLYTHTLSLLFPVVPLSSTKPPKQHQSYRNWILSWEKEIQNSTPQNIHNPWPKVFQIFTPPLYKTQHNIYLCVLWAYFQVTLLVSAATYISILLYIFILSQTVSVFVWIIPTNKQMRFKLELSV